MNSRSFPRNTLRAICRGDDLCAAVLTVLIQATAAHGRHIKISRSFIQSKLEGRKYCIDTIGRALSTLADLGYLEKTPRGPGQIGHYEVDLAAIDSAIMRMFGSPNPIADATVSSISAGVSAGDQSPILSKPQFSAQERSPHNLRFISAGEPSAEDRAEEPLAEDAPNKQSEKIQAVSFIFEPPLLQWCYEEQWGAFLTRIDIPFSHRPLVRMVIGTRIEPSFLILSETPTSNLTENGSPEAVPWWFQVCSDEYVRPYRHVQASELLWSDEIPERIRGELYVVPGGPSGVDHPDTSHIRGVWLWSDGAGGTSGDVQPYAHYFGECDSCHDVQLLSNSNATPPHAGCSGQYRPNGSRVRKAILESVWNEDDLVAYYRHIASRCPGKGAHTRKKPV